MRTTVDLTEEAYVIAKTVAREQDRSLGSVVSDFILGAFQPRPAPESTGELPSFRCKRRVTSEDVKALDDDE